jgi:uncharacterized protein
MKILMTGGTGFVGSYLSERLVKEGYEVTILVRPGEKVAKPPLSGISLLEGDPSRKGAWQDAVRTHDGAINLAGASIFSRWTDEKKRVIRESRLKTTQNIVEAIDARRGGAFTLLSTSAVGYYGFHGDEELTEDSPSGHDFLATLAVDWEAEALKAREKGTRVVLTRFGIVLGGGGGVLGQMVPLFKWFVGGPIGNGRQWFSWVHSSDLTEAFVFLLKHQEVSGPVNVCSPQPVRNKDLARVLGRVFHRPSLLPAPAFAVKLVLGEFGSVILEGQRVLPKKLLESGYVFQHPRIEEALASIIHR